MKISIIGTFHWWDCFLVEGNDASVFFGIICSILQVNFNLECWALVPGKENLALHFRFGLGQAATGAERCFLYLAQDLLLLFVLFQLLLVELCYRQIMFAEWLQRLLF